MPPREIPDSQDEDIVSGSSAGLPVGTRNDGNADASMADGIPQETDVERRRRSTGSSNDLSGVQRNESDDTNTDKVLRSKRRVTRARSSSPAQPPEDRTRRPGRPRRDTFHALRQESSDVESSPPARGYEIRGRFRCDCPDVMKASEPILVCKGEKTSIHNAPWKFHASCLGEESKDRFYFTCEACATDLQERVSNPESESSQDGDWISKERTDQNNNVEYAVVQTAGPERWVSSKQVSNSMLKDYHKRKLAERDQEDRKVVIDAHIRATNTQWHARLRKNEMFMALQRGSWSLAAATYPQIESHHANLWVTREAWADATDDDCSWFNPEVLNAVLGIGLRSSRLEYPNTIPAILQDLRSRSESRPCIYVLELVNKYGHSPTIGQTRKICDKVQRYLHPDLYSDPTDANFAVRVDEYQSVLDPARRAEVLKGSRRWLSGTEENQRDTLRPKILAMIRQLRTLMDVAEDEGFDSDDLIPFILNDVGYTDNGIVRIGQHLKGNSSNFVMKLFEAVAALVARDDQDDEYRLYGDVVFLCNNENQASKVEILLSCAAESYTWLGKGFNRVVAGVQNSSVRKYKDYWNDWQRQDIASGNSSTFFTAETARRAKYHQESQELDQQIAQFEGEVESLLDDGVDQVKQESSLLQEFSDLRDQVQDAAIERLETESGELYDQEIVMLSEEESLLKEANRLCRVLKGDAV